MRKDSKKSILAKAKKLGGKLPSSSMYGELFKNNKNNTEQILFEIAQQVNSDKKTKDATVRAVGTSLVELALELFPDVGIKDAFKKNKK